MEKGENAGDQHFLLFAKIFSTFPKLFSKQSEIRSLTMVLSGPARACELSPSFEPSPYEITKFHCSWNDCQKSQNVHFNKVQKHVTTTPYLNTLEEAVIFTKMCFCLFSKELYGGMDTFMYCRSCNRISFLQCIFLNSRKLHFVKFPSSQETKWS